MTENTSYEKISWNLTLINDSPHKIKNSLIFIGPSWVLGGINDSILNSFHFKSINMAVNKGGADLDYYFVSRILKHKPKIIYLHRFPNGQGVFHPMMPLLMSPIEYVLTFKYISYNFLFNYFSKRFYFVIKYIFSFFKKVENNPNKNMYYYGWRSEGKTHINLTNTKINQLIKDKTVLNEKIKVEFFSRNGVLIKLNHPVKNIWRTIYANYYNGNGERVRSMTVSLCDTKNIPVAEVYVPNFSDALYDSYFHSNNYFFSRKGIRKKCLCVKNVSFLATQNYWFDQDHLNCFGSTLFTDSLMKILPR